MPLPEWPPRSRDNLHKAGLTELFNWWQDFRSFMKSRMSTQGDITLVSDGKGVVLKNAAGTVTKRVRLNDLGDGIIIEDV